MIVVVHEWHCQIVKQAAASQWRAANLQGGMMNDSNEWCATNLQGGMQFLLVGMRRSPWCTKCRLVKIWQHSRQREEKILGKVIIDQGNQGHMGAPLGRGRNKEAG